jgi:hypothetical protein
MTDFNTEYGGRFAHVTDPNRAAYMANQYTQAGSPQGGWSADMSGYNANQNYLGPGGGGTNPVSDSSPYRDTLLDLQNKIAGLYDQPDIDLSYIDKQREALEQRRQASIDNINTGAAEQTRNTQTAQRGEVGATNLFMASAGALGRTGSAQGALLKQAQTHRQEIDSIEAQRQQLVSQAQAAYEDKDFEMAQFYVDSQEKLKKQKVESLQNLQNNLMQIARFDREQAQFESDMWMQQLEQDKLKAQDLAQTLVTDDYHTPGWDTINQYAQEYGIDPTVLANATRKYSQQKEVEDMEMQKLRNEMETMGLSKGNWSVTQLDDGTVVAFDKDSKDFNYKVVGKYESMPTLKFTTNPETGEVGTFNPQTGEFNTLQGGAGTPQGSDVSVQGSLVLPEEQRKTNAVINGYDFSSYAKDKKWGNSIKTKVNELNQKVGTPEELDNYIKTKQPNSPITSNMILDVAEMFDVDPYVLTSIIEHESYFGTSNVAKKNNNLGGIKWNANFGEEMKGTPRPSDERGYYVKFDSMEQGIMAIAVNMTRRKINGGQGNQGNTNNTPENMPEENDLSMLDPDEKKDFTKLIQSKLIQLDKEFGKEKEEGQQSSWAIVWNEVKRKFPLVPSEVIDKMLKKDMYYEQKWKKDSGIDYTQEYGLEEEEKEEEKIPWYKRFNPMNPFTWKNKNK